MSKVKKTEQYPEEKFMDRYADGEYKKNYFRAVDYHRKYSWFSLWFLFFAFSIGGWLWEVMYHWFSRGELVNRGSMYGPWVPIYGTAAVLITGFLWRLVDKPVWVFVSIVVISAVLEYSTSLFFDKVKGIRFWDYSLDFMNLNGRIYLEGILFFGIGGCVMLYLLAPILAVLQKKIPRKWLLAVLIICTVAFLADGIYSFQNPNIANGVTYVK